MHLRTVKSVPSPSWLNYTLAPLSNLTAARDLLSSPRELLSTPRDLSSPALARELLAPQLVPLYTDLAALSRPSAFSAIPRGAADRALDRLLQLSAPLGALALQGLKQNHPLELRNQALRLEDKR